MGIRRKVLLPCLALKPPFLAVQDSSIGDLESLLILQYNEYNYYNDNNDYNDYNYYNDYNDYNNYNDFRDSGLDLDLD